MASATTMSSSSFINLTPTKTKLLLHSSPSPTANASFPRQSLHHTHHRIRTSHVKINYSNGEQPESQEIDEVFFNGEDLIEEESDEEDDTESSIDLLIRFFQSMFKKVSKRAKKASRSVLPAAISPQLVSFAVDGVLLLASLSIVKALLEVVCTLGGTVFVVILLLRVIWATVSYFQSSGGRFNQGRSSFGTTQPVS